MVALREGVGGQAWNGRVEIDDDGVCWGFETTLLHELAHIYDHGVFLDHWGPEHAVAPPGWHELRAPMRHFDLTYKYERDADGLYIYDTPGNPEGTAGAGREPVQREYLVGDFFVDCGEEMFASALEHATNKWLGLETYGAYYGTGCAPGVLEPTPEDLEAIRPLMGVRS